MAAASGISTTSAPPNAVVAVQPGMNVQPVVLVDQNGGYLSFSGRLLCTPSSYAPASQTLISVINTSFSVFGISTTVASGSNGGEISTVASWSAPSSGVFDVASTTGFPSSGTLAVAASGSTVAVVTYTGTSGGNAFTGCAYVSGSATGTVATGGNVTLTSTSNLSTGSFIAPASGSVLVAASFVGESNSGSFAALGLAAHGTVTPMVSNVAEYQDSASTVPRPVTVQFLVTGLTPGTSYNFDLLGATVSGTLFTIMAYGQSATSPSTNRGAPVLMTVQAV